jgi:glutathione S-transferase
MRKEGLLMFLLAQTPLILGFVGGRHHWNRAILESVRRSPGSYMTNNPFTSMIGGMADSLFGKGNSVQSNPNVDSSLTLASSSSWSEVRSKLESLQTPEERAFRDNLSTGYGVGSPLHLLRLYSKENREEDVRVTFYRDSASWCPYCQKVWLTLEEKKIPYRVEKINMSCYGQKPASFMRIQPGGQIPVVIIDGQTYGQSNDILYALEEGFPNHKSLKPSQDQASKAQQYLRLERQIFSAWMYWLTGNGGNRAKNEFVQMLEEVEKALKSSDGPFFLGKEISQVDCMFTPFLERMCASLLFYKGFMMRVPKGAKTDYPNLNAWFDAMEKLPSYQLSKSDYYTHCWDLPPQLGGCTYEPSGQVFENAINGERSLDGTQGSWELPLQAHNGGVEPDWEWAGDEMAARREAVERISSNHGAIIRFASRGAGQKGMPGYRAPLSDPNAVPNEGVQQGVDTSIRTVCLALLDGVENLDEEMTKVASVIAKEGGKEYAEGVIASLGYLRDRVGVPRDMQLSAARQLRAHLNWSIGKILEAAE